ncbi:uncharacterized protein [Antedon mediterranea]|uniref:uncharacterized protein n=1 Tax=Antedon mediterranea TaxID=105859 RepID=UPI003AF9F8A3
MKKNKPEPISAPTDDQLLNDASNKTTSPSVVKRSSPKDSNNSSKESSPVSFARRRTNSLSLTPLVIEGHFNDDRGDHVDGVKSQHFFPDQNAIGEKYSEVQKEGLFLYHETFLKPEMSRRGIQEPDLIKQVYEKNVPNGLDSPSVKTPVGYNNPNWAKAGKELRIMADKFARSDEREKVTKKATKYSQSSIETYAEYSDLLTELFQSGGVTCHRLVVLFFFCSDLTIMALEHNCIDYFGRLVTWTYRFIRDGLSQWIASNGGWNAIVDTTRIYIDIIFKVALIAVAGAIVYRVFIGR